MPKPRVKAAPPQAPFRWADLPPDVQREVLLKRPELIPVVSQVSKTLYRTATRPYVDVTCARDFSLGEIERYLRAGVGTFGYYTVRNFPAQSFTSFVICSSSPRTGDGNITDFATYSLDVTSQALRPDEIPELEGVDLSGDDRRFFTDGLDIDNSSEIDGLEDVIESLRSRWIPTDTSSEVSLDLLTSYRILTNRRGCMARDANFAKDSVLFMLDDTFNYYSESSHVSVTLFVWSWLYLQARVLNIYPLPHIARIDANVFDADGNIVVVAEGATAEEVTNDIGTKQAEIEDMFPKIRSALERL